MDDERLPQDAIDAVGPVELPSEASGVAGEAEIAAVLTDPRTGRTRRDPGAGAWRRGGW